MNRSYLHKISVPVEGVVLQGELFVPEKPRALVIFSHGSGSSRFSPRNSFVAGELNKSGIVTFLFDLLTYPEDKIPTNRFNIQLLTKRLIKVTNWLASFPMTRELPTGYFGASTGAASALAAAAELPSSIQAVVCRGGRPDLVPSKLPFVKAPTLLIVGEHDHEVLELNRTSAGKMNCEVSLEVVELAAHLFEEPGALETVAKLANEWFIKHLLVKPVSRPLTPVT